MLDMRLNVEPKADDMIFASFTCPCGCHPGTDLHQGATLATESCCCGTRFAIGNEAAGHILGQQYLAQPGFQLVVSPVTAPWGQTVAAWAVGDDFSACHCDHELDPAANAGGTQVMDRVCGMLVTAEKATEKGLTATHLGQDYYFCSKGCRLDFLDDPDRILDPAYDPAM